MTPLRPLLLASLLLGAFIAPARAQEPASTSSPSPSTASSKEWNYIVEPYFLVPAMSGTSGVHGREAKVSANSGDILGALDFGAMLYFQMQNPEWAIVLDNTYMNLGASSDNPLGTVDIDLKQTGIMLAGYRRIAPYAEGMAGLTYNKIKAALTSSGPLGFNQAGTQDWVDPYVGVRLSSPDPVKWRLTFTGMVGGFSIGSKFAWQVFPEVGYRFSPLFELAGGYRAIGMDYENGSGNQKFVYDVTTYGPQLGLKFHF
jgi:hypothetical protein